MAIAGGAAIVATGAIASSALAPSGPDGNTTSTSTTTPWGPQQPYLLQQMQDAQAAYNKGQLAPSYFPGQAVASQSPYTQQGINLTAQRALNGSPVTAASQNQVADTLNGNYLDPQNNPYFKGALNNISDAYARGTAAQTAGAFNKAGSFGGSAYDETMKANNQAFADSLNNLGNTQYQQGRTQQLQAAALAPETANQDYTNLSALGTAGSTQDAYNQSLINAQMAAYNQNSQQPMTALSNYQRLISGNLGNSTTQSSPYFNNSNPLGVGLGLLGQTGMLNPNSSSYFGNIGGNSSGSSSSLPWLSPSFDQSAYSNGLPWSDIRLKEDITHIGHAKGFPIYAFRYKSDPEKILYRGVMAQDVALTRPDAVMSDGEYMAVDYRKIGVEFATIH